MPEVTESELSDKAGDDFDLTDAEWTAAIGRGRLASLREPRAASAGHDAARRRVAVERTNGCPFAFRARRMQGLEKADDALLGQVEILADSYGLRWEAIDVDLSVPGAMAGHTGTRRFIAGQLNDPACVSAVGRKTGWTPRPCCAGSTGLRDRPII